MSFNLDNYEDVDSRLHKFWEENPMGRIHTEIVHMGEDKDGKLVQILMKAYIWTDKSLRDEPNNFVATGYAEEQLTNYGVNKTSMVENCETSAIGRALANAGYSSKGARASRQEMEKVERAGTNAGSFVTQIGNKAPTDKQKKYALQLLAGRDWLTEEFRAEKGITGTLDKFQTADFITWLLERPVTAADINRKDEPLIPQPHDIETGGW